MWRTPRPSCCNTCTPWTEYEVSRGNHAFLMFVEVEILKKLDCFAPNTRLCVWVERQPDRQRTDRQQALCLCQTAAVYGTWLWQFVEADLSLWGLSTHRIRLFWQACPAQYRSNKTAEKHTRLRGGSMLTEGREKPRRADKGRATVTDPVLPNSFLLPL